MDNTSQPSSRTSMVIGTLGGVGLLLAAMILGSRLALFINLPSAAISVGGLFLVAYLTSGNSLWQALRTAYSAQSTAEDAAQSYVVLKRMQHIAFTLGAFGMLSGCVTMLTVAHEPVKIGPSLAVALLSFYYATLLAGFWLGPLADRLQRCHPEVSMPDTPSSVPQMATLSAVLVLVSFTYWILFLFLPPF